VRRATDLVVLYCVACWTATDHVYGSGGTPYDIGTVAACQAACISDRSCVAVDWDPTNTGRTCWIQTSLTTRPTTNLTIVHYELNPRCQG